MMLIISYIILLIFILLTDKKKATFVKEEGVSWYVNSIGNILCSYFYRMGRAWHKNETFIWDEKFENEFYNNLPQKIDPPKNLILPDYDTSKLSTHAGYENVSAWMCDTEEARDFWTAMKPYINKIVDDALRKSGLHIHQKNPIIHFRCSDIPFARNNDYHFQKYSYFKQAIGDAKEVDIVSCHTHLSDEKNQKSCEEYVKLLKNELGIKTNIKCRHYFEDFAAMFYAPKVISTGSSMSFMAGFFGNGEFITAGHFREDSNLTCTICKYDKDVNLLHANVNDYHNTDDVHNKLSGM